MKMKKQRTDRENFDIANAEIQSFKYLTRDQKTTAFNCLIYIQPLMTNDFIQLLSELNSAIEELETK
jgi:hypothetical protein